MNTKKVTQKVKPNGAKQFKFGDDYSADLVTIVSYESGDEHVVELAMKQAAIAIAAKVRADMGNTDEKGKPTFVSAEDWKAHVAKWNNREVTCEYLLSPTSKKDIKSAVNAEMIQRFMRGMNMTRGQAITFCEENNLFE